jgi:hypothetical protein
MVMEAPWASASFADGAGREKLSTVIRDHEVDVVIVGPLSRSGMNDAGTLQDVAEFMKLTSDVRTSSGRPVTVILVHHEGKSGKVSGAWEGSGDTLFHVTGQGHGHTRLYIQKARWASAYHAVKLDLAWTTGEGFVRHDKEEIDDAKLADLILRALAADPGLSWTKVEAATPGVNRQRRMAVRDRLLAGGRIVNIGKEDGAEVALAECPERKPARLYLADDPTIKHLLPARGADGEQTGSRWRPCNCSLLPAL